MFFVNFTEEGNADNAARFQARERLERAGKLTGTDPFDGSPCEFIHAGGDLREGLISSASGSIQRQRVMVAGLSQYLFGEPDHTLAHCCKHINQHRLRLYTAEANSAIFEFLKKHLEPSLFYFSEYLGNQYKPGERVGGVPHEDLQELSFPDDYFDIVLTAEVMEHVPDALKAEQEILRVLKPGGAYVFTVPYLANSLFDRVRAVMEKGQIRHMETPEYHGDPLRPTKGILVYRIFSEGGLRSRFTRAHASFSTYSLFDETKGIISEDAFVHLVMKGAAASMPAKVQLNFSRVPSPCRSFIFTHIPKCAGTSFREYICQAGMENGVPTDRIHVPGYLELPIDKNIAQLSKKELATYRRQKMKVLAAHCLFDVNREYKLNMEVPFYYTILREPLTRFVSHYNYFYRHSTCGGLHINELDEKRLTGILTLLANLQLIYTINGRYYYLNTVSFLKKTEMQTRRLLRRLTFDRYFIAIPIGLRTTDAWLKQAIKTLETSYGAFGIFEKMDASLNLLRAAAPGWLDFSNLEFPVRNEQTSGFAQEEPPDKRVLALFQKYHAFDLKFYEQAVALFEKRMGQ